MNNKYLENGNVTKREIWVDYLKAIAIFLVIFPHLGVNDKFFITSMIINIPLFFFCSGYLYKQIEIKKAFKKYFYRLIIPYICFNIFEFVFETLLEHHESASAFLHNLISNFDITYLITFFTVDVHGTHFNMMTWYLIALFVVLILFTTLKQYLKNDKQLVATMLILVALAYLLNMFELQIPWEINGALVGIAFFFVGYLFKKYKLHEFMSSNNILNFIILITFPLVSVILALKGNKFSWFVGGIYGNILLSYASSFLLLFFMILVTYTLQNRNKLIYLISVNTLTIMGLGVSAIKLSDKTMKLSSLNTVDKIVLTALILIILAIVGELLTRYVPIIVGRKKLKESD